MIHCKADPLFFSHLASKMSSRFAVSAALLCAVVLSLSAAESSAFDGLPNEPASAFENAGVEVRAIEADGSQRRQAIAHFGASMLWTIDPTEGWPEETKERLARKLMSRAGGIGLSNLRFDFGGGNHDTGARTSEPWTWRFPEPMKDGPEAGFDWARREGQQWFLRRARDIGMDQLTFASISPPWWMTKSGDTFPSPESGSTNLDPDKADDYARYLVDVVRHFRDEENITFTHLTPVNEPEWKWEAGGQEGNRATAADIRAMIVPLYAELSKHGLEEETRILVAEHGQINAALDDSYHIELTGGVWTGGVNNQYGKYREYIQDLYTHPEVVGKIEPVVAYHAYWTDGRNVLDGRLRSLFHKNAAENGLGVMQTEYCILGPAGPGRNLQMGPARQVFRVIHKDLTEARAKAWDWWLALSPHDYKDGLVYTDFDRVGKENPQLFDSKVLWVLGNFSRFLRPGYEQIGSGGHDDLDGLMASTWQSPDGREVIIVAGNFSNSGIPVSLPAEAPGVAGKIREWEPWVTDAGRNLRRETPFDGAAYLLPPQSVTTFVGRTSQSPFRARVSVEAESPSVAPGDSVELTARATWEDGAFVIPAIDSGTEWVFHPVTREPVGFLRDGRYFLRRRSDQAFLSVIDSAEPDAALVTREEKDPTHAWDVRVGDDGDLFLTHTVSGRGIASGPAGAAARKAGPAALRADRVEIEAEYSWRDNAGEGASIDVRPPMTAWYEVKARIGDDRAFNRIRIRVGEKELTLQGLPEVIFTRPGEPVDLRVEPVDTGRSWIFRIVPADRDAVVSAISGSELDMRDPKGETFEEWRFVDAEDGRIWPAVEEGRPVRIQPISLGRPRRYLAPEGGSTDAATPLTTTAIPGPESLWVVDSADHGRFRVRHEESGLVLNISGTTGKPILWPDTGAGNDRFHLDSIDEDPFRLAWSHDLGAASGQTVAPERSTTYTVYGQKGGVTVAASTRVIVRQTFDEWAGLWFGDGESIEPLGDENNNAVPNLMEYARGSNPLRPEPGWEWPVIRREKSALTIASPKNPEAIGSWEVESSETLLSWQAATEFELIEDSFDQFELRLTPEVSGSRFFRFRFVAE